jgi:nicotinamide-nucleotide amidase
MESQLTPKKSLPQTEPIETRLVEILGSRNETLAIAESCTGGLVAHRITNVSGASLVFWEGCVTYSNEAKERALGVPRSLLESFGAVSHEVAAAMAEGVYKRAGTTYGIATTGIAGPTGGTEGKPVGSLWIAVATRDSPTHVEHHLFSTDRLTFKQLASDAVLQLLWQVISEKH